MRPPPDRLRDATTRTTTATALCAIVAAAAGIRVWAALRYGSMIMFSDMAHYNDAAIADGFPTSVPPAYPLFLRMIYGMFGANNFTAVYFVQALIGALSVLLLYRVTARISTPRTGLLAAGIAACYPNFIAYTTTIMTETIGVLFVTLLLAACVEPMSERRRSIVVAIVVFAGAAFRPVMLFFAPGAFAGLKKRLVFSLAIAACLVPFVVAATLSGSDFHRGARGLYRGYNPDASGKYYAKLEDTELGEREAPSWVYIASALSFIKDNKWRTLDIMYAKATVAFDRGWDTFILQSSLGRSARTDSIMTYAFLPVMALGFVGMIRRFNKTNRIVAFLALSYVAGFVIVSIFKVRYRLLVEPILIVYASMLVGGSHRHGRWRGIGAWFRGLVAAPEPDPILAAQVLRTPSKGGRTRGWLHWDALRRGRDWKILLALIGAAVAIRLYLASTQPEPVRNSEMLAYRALAISGGLDSTTPPLYPLLLRLLYSIFGDTRGAAVYAVQGILNAFLVLIMYSTAARLGNRRAGIVAASIAVVYPNFLAYNLTLLSESLIVLIAALLLAATTSSLSRGAKALASAAVVGAGALTQPTFVCFVPGMLAATKRWRLFLLALMVILVPYVARNVAERERIEPLYEAHAFNLSLKNFTEAADVRHAIDAMFDNASAMLRRGTVIDIDQGTPSARNRAYAMRYGYVLIELLGLTGLIKYWSAKHRPVIVPFLSYALLLILFSKFEMRHRVPLEPLFIAYAGMLLGGARRYEKGEPT